MAALQDVEEQGEGWYVSNVKYVQPPSRDAQTPTQVRRLIHLMEHLRQFSKYPHHGHPWRGKHTHARGFGTAAHRAMLVLMPAPSKKKLPRFRFPTTFASRPNPWSLGPCCRDKPMPTGTSPALHQTSTPCPFTGWCHLSSYHRSCSSHTLFQSPRQEAVKVSQTTWHGRGSAQLDIQLDPTPRPSVSLQQSGILTPKRSYRNAAHTGLLQGAAG